MVEATEWKDYDWEIIDWYGFKVKHTFRDIFEIYEIENRDFKGGYVYRQWLKDKEKEGNLKPFIYHSLKGKNTTGSAASRVWIQGPDDPAAMIAIPMHMLKDEFHLEHFPTFAANALKNAANKFAPGEYIMKFPNDVVCKKCGKKTGGILVRKECGYLLAKFGFNLVSHPTDDQLRKEGLRACCLKNHCTGRIPSISEFVYTVAQGIVELMNKFDLPSFVEWINAELSAFKKKSFRVEINNPNAVLSRDGVLWTRDHPNALEKGYLNGEEYEAEPWLYDTVYYEGKDSNEEKVADRKTRELREQREKEKKEKEEAEKKKEEEKKKEK